MKNRIVGIALSLAMASISPGQTPSATPVVIELFTSEGCSSCPPADLLLTELDRTQPVAGVQLIVLSEHVDYWNTLGWMDPYSSHQFTERQQRYGEALHVPDVYTPQAVIDGRNQVVGNSAPKLQAAIELARRQRKIPLILEVARRDKGIHVKLHAVEAPPHGAEVYFALAEDEVTSKVSAGENGGHVLTHTAVVRTLLKAGKLAAAGEPGVSLDLKLGSHSAKPMRVVAFLAERDGGKILGAAVTTF